MGTELTKEKIIRASFGLVGLKGFPATTVDEICAAAKVSKGSFYHFFKSKEELGLAMLDEFWARDKAMLENGIYPNETDPSRRLEMFFDHMEQTAPDMLRDGCLIGNFSMELAGTSTAVQKRVSEIFKEMTETMAPLFAEADLASHGKVSPRDLARQFVAVIEGSILFAKAHKDIRFIPEGIRNFRNLLMPDSAIPVVGPGTKIQSPARGRESDHSATA